MTERPANPSLPMPVARPLGVIAVTDKENGQIFTMDDQEFLTVFAAQAGIALQNATLFEKATVDTLTRLFTRQYFFAQAEEIVIAHKSAGGPVCLLMCDLDHFKQKNDQYGHQTGDLILQEAGRIVKAKLPGLCARYGGEEIVVLMPGSDKARATAAAEDVRKTMEEFNFGAPEDPIRCTISLGIAALTKEDTIETLLRKADSALYTAKREGRNQVRFFDGTDVPPPTKSGVLRLQLPPKTTS